MGPEIILVPGVFVDVRRSQHRKPLFLGRQRYRAPDLRPGPFGRFDDFAGRNVDQPVVKGFQPDSNVLVCRHIALPIQFPAAHCSRPVFTC